MADNPERGAWATRFNQRATGPFIDSGPGAPTADSGLGSIYMRYTNGDIHQKTGAGSTGWTLQGTPRGYYMMPTGALADTTERDRALVSPTLVSATLNLNAIELKAGMVISNFNLRTAGQVMATGTNQWMGLYTPAGVQLAVSADQGLSGMAALTNFAWPVATTAAGAATSYTVPSTGLYYLGTMIKAGTMPSLVGYTCTTHALIPMPCVTADTGQAAVNAFPFTTAAFAGSTLALYQWVS